MTGSTRRSRVGEPLALLALALDAGLGWPDRLYARVGHPVGAFAFVIERWERRWNRADRSARRRRLAGAALMLALTAATTAASLGVEAAARALLGRWWWVGVAVAAWPGLAQRSLFEHVHPVAVALRASDLPAARAAVGRIVGRDVAGLDEAGIARAAIESLAESFADGVLAPLFWLVALGLPGLWTYKTINTADSLIGHREERWRAFGWAAARLDDLANLAPARLAGTVLCVAGGGGWRVMARDHRRHASPNAGWPEAAMAGALGVALAGPAIYDGAALDKAWINAEGRAATTADIDRGLGVYARGCALLWLVAAGVAWRR